MTSDEKKRRRERFLLERFLERQGIKPKSIDQPKPPNPDFIIDLDGRMVGIEMTEIFIRFDESKEHSRGAEGLLLQEVESITDLIVSQAREIYFKANDTPVLTDILFSQQITRDKKKGKQIAELIANKIQDMMSGNSSERLHWGPDDVLDNGEQFLTEAVDHIYIFRVPEKRSAHWAVMRPGFVADLTPKHLQDRIDLKVQKLEGYRKNRNSEEIWLLMVADRTRPSQRLQRRLDLPLGSLYSSFEKTFYFCYPTDEPVVEL